MPNPNHVVRDAKQVAEDTEKGRPLWLSEINKNVPAGATYELESTFGAKTHLNKTRAYAFHSHNAEKNKMMAEEPDLAKFRNTCETVPAEGIASYDIKLTQTKKRNPVFSQTLSK